MEPPPTVGRFAHPALAFIGRILANCRREWRLLAGYIRRPPAVVGACLGLIALVMVLPGNFDGWHIDFERLEDGTRSGYFELHRDGGRSQRLETVRRQIAVPFYWVHFAAVLLMLLKDLPGGRRDGPAPLPDSARGGAAEVLLGRLLTAVWIAPAVTVAAILAAQLALLVLVSALVAAGGETPGTWSILAAARLFPGALELALGYLIQGFWALPIYGWALLLNVAAKRHPVWWTLLPPLALVCAEWALIADDAAEPLLLAHLEFRALPLPGHHEYWGIEESTQLLETPNFWVGAAVGALFVIGAVALRHRQLR